MWNKGHIKMHADHSAELLFFKFCKFSSVQQLMSPHFLSFKCFGGNKARQSAAVNCDATEVFRAFFGVVLRCISGFKSIIKQVTNILPGDT